MFTLLLLMSCKSGIKVEWEHVDANLKESKPNVEVYMENSGSMNGYMCNGSELKDAVYDYVSSLANYASKTNLNYINSQVVPFTGTIKTFIWNMTPYTFAQVQGNHTYSQMNAMLDTIIHRTDKNTVSVFVSDCILTVPQGNAMDFYNITQTDIKNIVENKLKNDSAFAVIIMQLKSKFVGKYYGGDGITLLNGEKRPYYIWIMGDKDKLAFLNSRINLDKIKHGYDNYVSYSLPTQIDYDIQNKFGKGAKATGNKKLLEIKKDEGKDYTINIKTNCYPTLLNDKILNDISTYKINNPLIKIKSVNTIDDPRFTHQILLTIKRGIKSSGELLSISTPTTLPQWVSLSNDDTGKNIFKNISKTTGIKYIIGGVSDVFSNNKYRTTIKFAISK